MMFIWFIMKQLDSTIPSMSKVKTFTLPSLLKPIKVGSMLTANQQHLSIEKVNIYFVSSKLLSIQQFAITVTNTSHSIARPKEFHSM